MSTDPLAADPLPAEDPAPDVPTEALAPSRRRAHTESMKRLSKRELERGRYEHPAGVNDADPRPLTWGECPDRRADGMLDAYRPGDPLPPCPWVSCVHHLAYDVNPASGAIKSNFPDMELDEMPATCELEVAAKGEHTLEQVAVYMNLTRERIRQLETRGLFKLRNQLPPEQLAVLKDHLDGIGMGEAAIEPANLVGADLTKMTRRTTHSLFAWAQRILNAAARGEHGVPELPGVTPDQQAMLTAQIRAHKRKQGWDLSVQAVARTLRAFGCRAPVVHMELDDRSDALEQTSVRERATPGDPGDD